MINIAADHQMFMTHRRTKLTASETISRWLLLKESPFRRLRGNVCTPPIARWKAHCRLYIRHNWTFFAISYGWDVISGNLSKSAFLERGWVTLSADLVGKGASPTKHCWCQSSRVSVWYQNICSAPFRFVTIHACDRQTDRQNYDSQDRPRICSRGKNHKRR